MASAGGIPIFDGITVIGAIGVAGSEDPEDDVLCCRAGIEVLTAAVQWSDGQSRKGFREPDQTSCR